MIVYLSGPMTGLPHHNYPAFDDAAFFLREHGFTVLNPAEHFGGRRDLDRKVYLRRDIEDELLVEALVSLPNWHQAEGAKGEAVVAKMLGLPLLCYICLRWFLMLTKTVTREEAIDKAATCSCFSRNVNITVGGTPAVPVYTYDPAAPSLASISGKPAPERVALKIPNATAQMEHTPWCVPSGINSSPPPGVRPLYNEVAPAGTVNVNEVREQFTTGSQRDSRTGKGRYDLLPWAGIHEVAQVCEEGAKHYGDRNIEKGQPIGRLLDSATRHISEYMRGIKVEPRVLARAAWNVLWAIQFDQSDRPDLQDIPAQQADQKDAA